jgi:hypothetical protein
MRTAVHTASDIPHPLPPAFFSFSFICRSYTRSLLVIQNRHISFFVRRLVHRKPARCLKNGKSSLMKGSNGSRSAGRILLGTTKFPLNIHVSKPTHIRAGILFFTTQCLWRMPQNFSLLAETARAKKQRGPLFIIKKLGSFLSFRKCSKVCCSYSQLAFIVGASSILTTFT